VSAPPTFLRRDARHICEGCGMNARGVVLARRLSTGERQELPLCERCRVTPERTIWRRWEADAR